MQIDEWVKVEEEEEEEEEEESYIFFYKGEKSFFILLYSVREIVWLLQEVSFCEAGKATYRNNF
jgi:hypothetical protein